MHACTDYDDVKDLIRGKREKCPIERGEGRSSAVELTKRQTTKYKLLVMEERAVEGTKNAYFCETKTYVRASPSKIDVYHNGHLVQILQIDGCVQKVVPIWLRERNRHARHHKTTVSHSGQ